jgi:transcription elongation factor GreA
VHKRVRRTDKKEETRSNNVIMKKIFRLTPEGADELRLELNQLTADRSVIADRIRTAREFGDLSENAEYQSARSDQEKNESRISEIEHILTNVELIMSPKGDNRVQLGSKVTLQVAGKTKEFQIVGTVEADPIAGKVSDESPIGRILIGKKLGDEVELRSPAETVIYKITDIA